MRTQTRALTSPSSQHRHLELQPVVGRDSPASARIEGAARGAADIAAGAELPRQLPASGCRWRRCGPAARRCCRRARPAAGKRRRISASERARPARRRPASRSARDAARHDAVHHQAMAEAGVGRAQHALAQDAAVGVHEREGGVVADRADVAEMIGEALELGHQRAQPDARAAAPRRRARPRRRGRRRAHRRPCCRRRRGRRAAPPARASAPAISASMPLCT